MDSQAIAWIFLVDTLNFSFWSEKKDTSGREVKYQVNYKNKIYEGYWALCAAINRAIDNGIPVLDPVYYSKITKENLQFILQSSSSTCIPLIDKRVEILRETGEILIKNFNGNFMNCIKLANGSAISLLKLIVEYFPSYRDESIFNARRVSFYKRAQILVADLWACFEGKSYGFFYDIDKISMFADYRVPQVLHFCEVLQYSNDLQAVLDEERIMSAGDEYEMEIRAGSILSCNMITQKINEDLKPLSEEKINDIYVDYYLWNLRIDNAAEIDSKSKYHKIRGIFY